MKTKILTTTARVFDIPEARLLSRSRVQYVAEARFAAMYVMRLVDRLSYREIADRFQRKSHDTAEHGVSRAKDLAAIDAKFAAYVGAIEKAVRR